LKSDGEVMLVFRLVVAHVNALHKTCNVLFALLIGEARDVVDRLAILLVPTDVMLLRFAALDRKSCIV